VFTPLPSPTESLHQDIVILTSRRDRDTLEVWSELFFMILEEVVLSSRLTLEIHINTRSKLSTSSLLRVPTLDNMSSAEEKQLFPQATSFLLIRFQKVLPFAILNHLLEIKDHTLDARVPTLQLWVTLMMEQKPESDYLLAQERLFPEPAELLSASLLEEEEMKSPLWKQEFYSTNSKDWERDSLRLQVWEWIP